MVDDFNSETSFTFSLFAFFPFSLFSRPSQYVSLKPIDNFQTSRTFFSFFFLFVFWKSFKHFYLCCVVILLPFNYQAQRLICTGIFSLLFLKICLRFRKTVDCFFHSVIIVHDTIGTKTLFCLFVLSVGDICQKAYPGSYSQLQNNFSIWLVFAIIFCLSISSRFSILGLISVQLSLSFPETNAIFRDLCFFHGIYQNGDTKHFPFILPIFSWFAISFIFFLFLLLLKNSEIFVSFFLQLECVRVSVVFSSPRPSVS